MMDEGRFLREIIQICETLADFHNPSDGQHCFYTRGKGEKYPDRAYVHDIIGEWMRANGFKQHIPPHGVVCNAYDLFSGIEALKPLASVAHLVQSFSDKEVELGYRPPNWRQVGKDIQGYLRPELTRK